MNNPRILVACEFTGVVRDAFIRRGFDAISCDIDGTEIPGPHITDDIRNVNLLEYDLMIAHPPCTYLATIGSWQWKYKQTEQDEALELVEYLLYSDVPHIALENPVSIISTLIRKPDQYIEPWYFGHPETKRTCLWLKNLPRLEWTSLVKPRQSIMDRVINSQHRSEDRSRTYHGVADAMAVQWGNFLKNIQ